MSQKLKVLYHGSSSIINGLLEPVFRQDSPNHVHTRASVFATDRPDVASLFMFPFKEHIASIGFEESVAFICIWGTPEEFVAKDKGGFLYTILSDNFEKVGKKYEWQSFVPVHPIEMKHFDSVIDGMISCGAKIYFVNDDKIMDQIRDSVGNRMPILEKLKPENKKRASCAL